MKRVEALEYLTNTYAELAADSQFSESARLIAYDLVIDQSLRALGFAEADIASAEVVESAEITAYYAFLDYYTLARFLVTYSVRTDVSIAGGLSTSQSQSFAQVKQLLDMASEKLAGLNLLSQTAQITVGRLNLDIYEPSLEGG